MADKETDQSVVRTRSWYSGFIRYLLLVLLLAVAVFLAVQWFKQKQDTQNSDNRTVFVRKVESLQGKVDAMNSQLGYTQERLAAAYERISSLENSYQDMAGGQDKLITLKIEHAFALARQELQLSGNLPLAIAALREARDRTSELEAKEHASILGKAIDSDIERLKALPVVDLVAVGQHIENTLIRLDSLVSGIHEMRAAADAAALSKKANKDSSSWWDNFKSNTWHHMKTLIQVKRIKNDSALLSPKEQWFLRESLKQRLLSARLALLSRNQTSYTTELESVHEQIRQHFDQSDENIESFLNVIKGLAETKIRLEFPDFTDSLDALSRLKRSLNEKKGSVRESSESESGEPENSGSESSDSLTQLKEEAVMQPEKETQASAGNTSNNPPIGEPSTKLDSGPYDSYHSESM